MNLYSSTFWGKLPSFLSRIRDLKPQIYTEFKYLSSWQILGWKSDKERENGLNAGPDIKDLWKNLDTKTIINKDETE